VRRRTSPFSMLMDNKEVSLWERVTNAPSAGRFGTEHMVSAVQSRRKQRNRNKIYFCGAVNTVMPIGLLPNSFPAHCSRGLSLSHPAISAARLLPIQGNSLSPASPRV
jgi:hypothetical protein